MRPVLLTLALCPALVLAQSVPASCDTQRELDKYALLRRLSLDLRGKAPTYEEYVALDAKNGVPDALVHDFVSSDEFRQVMRWYHEKMFWPNVSNVQLNNVNSALQQLAGPDAMAISSAGKRKIYRGLSDVTTTALGVQCGDFEQTSFGPDKVPLDIRTSVINGITVRQEGWRMVTPYWSTTPVKVCAYDAQEVTSVTVSGKTYDCSKPEGDARKECGCGPNLRWCYGPAASVRTLLLGDMREQLGLMVDSVTTGGRPYTELVTSKKTFVNGRLQFWKKNLAAHLSYSRIVAAPDANEALPNPDFATETWAEVDRGSGMHAGVLTTAAYMLRFQTNRGRANRYRIDFECQAFVPSTTLEDTSAGCAGDGTDLTKRCNCRYCHQQLEPLAAHWGNFSEAGTTLMTAANGWPKTNAACVSGNPGAFCNRYYVTADDADNPGAFLPYQYADAAHPEIKQALIDGPRVRAQKSIDDGTFARCAVRRVWSYFLKRDLNSVGSSTEESERITALADGFKSNAFSMQWLVEQVVSQPEYRRVR